MTLSDEDKNYIDVRIREARESIETRLLTEMRKWARPMELRSQSHADAMLAVDLDLGNVRERISKLDPKPNFFTPPRDTNGA